jgi:tetratricopeptide (TPR) repeat protein
MPSKPKQNKATKAAAAQRRRTKAPGGNKSGRKAKQPNPTPHGANVDTAIQELPVYEMREARAVDARDSDAELFDAARSQWLTADWDGLAGWHLSEFANHPKRARIALLVAAALHEVGDYDGSKEALRQAVEWGAQRRDLINVVIGQAHAALGRARLATKDFSRAESHFLECVNNIAPNRSALRYAKDRVFKEAAALGFLPDACRMLQSEISHAMKNAIEPQCEAALLETKIAFLSRHLSPHYQSESIPLTTSMAAISAAKARIALAEEPANSPNALARRSANKLVSRPAFFSLWRGSQLSALEWLSLKSFVDLGYEYTMYTYCHDLDVPAGVVVADASQICEAQELDKFVYAGSAAGSRFAAGSDYFRYLGIRKTKKCWVDTDVICLSDSMRGADSLLLAPEDSLYFNVAIFGIGPQEMPFLDAIIEECETLKDSGPLTWGALSPKLVTKVINEQFPEIRQRTRETSLFYPLHWKEAGWVLAPSKAAEARERTRESWFVHLWNEVLTRNGYYKDLMPPEDSYLRELVSLHQLEDIFVGSPPAHIIEGLVGRFV